MDNGRKGAVNYIMIAMAMATVIAKDDVIQADRDTVSKR